MGPEGLTTGAEMRTILESLGLPLDWTATYPGVGAGTRRQWEAQRRTERVPRDVDRRLWALLDAYEEYVRSGCEDRVRDPHPSVRTFLRFRGDADAEVTLAAEGVNLPEATHGLAQLRIARRVQEHFDVPARLIWFNPAEFGRWLEREHSGAGENVALREEWAETIPWPGEA